MNDPGAQEVCLCFHVSLAKLLAFARRTNLRHEAQFAECGGAGTGCGFCRPELKRLFDAMRADRGAAVAIDFTDYAERRDRWRAGRGQSLVEDDEPLEDALE